MDIWIVILLGLLLTAGFWIFRQRRQREAVPSQSKRSAPTPATVGIAATTLPQELAIVMPNQIVVTDGDDEVFSMMLLDNDQTARNWLQSATPLAFDGTSKVVSRLIEPLMQVAPSVGTAVMAGNSKLMEVVINGPLLAASDGNGLRAIAKAGKGFEHARLFEPKNLQNVANAAAIWQIVSAVVAQKHLADISATLQRMENKVASIQASLEDARYAVIRSGSSSD